MKVIHQTYYQQMVHDCLSPEPHKQTVMSPTTSLPIVELTAGSVLLAGTTPNTWNVEGLKTALFLVTFKHRRKRKSKSWSAKDSWCGQRKHEIDH